MVTLSTSSTLYQIVSQMGVQASSGRPLIIKIFLFLICCPVSCAFEQAVQYISDTLLSNPD